MVKKVINWNQLETKAQKMTVSELVYAIRDCRLAAEASRGWNPDAECYYYDEAAVYLMELKRR
jgi:hypothetical protein